MNEVAKIERKRKLLVLFYKKKKSFVKAKVYPLDF